MNQKELNKAFIKAYENSDLEKMKCLTAELNKYHSVFAPISFDEDLEYNKLLFIHACENGDLENVKHYLTSPDLTENVDIHFDDDDGFRYACEKGHLNVVQYLLISPELSDHNYFTDYEEFTSIKDFADKFGEECTVNILINLPHDSYDKLLKNPSDMEYTLNLFDNLSPELSQQVMEKNGDFAYNLYLDNGLEMPDNLKEFTHLGEIKQEHHQEIELHF